MIRGVKSWTEMARIEIATLVRRYHQLEQEIDSISQHLVELIKTSVEHEWLSTVPGLGDTTIVDLLAEIGSLSHYEDPRQLLKLAGLTLREISSGMREKRSVYSKKWIYKVRLQQDLIFNIQPVEKSSLGKLNCALEELYP
jgi:transposase